MALHAELRKAAPTIPSTEPTATRTKLYDDCEAVGTRLIQVEIEERPWLICDGLGLKEIRQLASRNFDRSLLNFAPEGHAWDKLLNSNPSERAEVFRFLRAGFRGESFILGAETITGVVISNLWLGAGTSQPGRQNAVRADPLWETFLFADLRDTETDFDPVVLESVKEVEWWDRFMTDLFEQPSAGRVATR